MRKDFIKKHFNTEGKPAFVEYGYGQVEPNHLSAQRTGQTYAQLPAAPGIEVLQQGQFVKYDYANEAVNFTGAGEWMLVFNEIKLYREGQMDCEFAMIKDNYQARIYSPYDYEWAEKDKQALHYNGGPDVVVKPDQYNLVDAEGVTEQNVTNYFIKVDGNYVRASEVTENTDYYERIPGVSYSVDDVTAPVDPYEIDYTEDPFHFLGTYKPRKMPKDTTMVPRVFKTNIGDIYTTNTVDDEAPEVGMLLGVDATTGFLVDAAGAKAANIGNDTMRWQVVKKYTMPDHQPGVKLMRIA